MSITNYYKLWCLNAGRRKGNSSLQCDMLIKNPPLKGLNVAYVHNMKLTIFYGFQYLGNIIGKTNNNNKCIKDRIMMGKKAYYANRQVVNSSLISRSSQLQIYRTVVRPVVAYGSESWTLTMEEEGVLAVFERKILRKIYGPVKENEGRRIRRNDELEDIIKGENIVKFIKSK
jgi:hypothetical protein